MIEEKEGPHHPLVKLARESITSWLSSGRLPESPPAIRDDPSLPDRAAAFVSLKRSGKLRGCIGTILPVRDTLTEEVMVNAVSAAVRDPRFNPVTETELDDLTITVDVLTEPEPVDDVALLDPVRYGVIVSSRGRTGVLLPDLPGIETVEQQLDIARQKAGIPTSEEAEISRFEVIRFR